MVKRGAERQDEGPEGAGRVQRQQSKGAGDSWKRGRGVPFALQKGGEGGQIQKDLSCCYSLPVTDSSGTNCVCLV